MSGDGAGSVAAGAGLPQLSAKQRERLTRRLAQPQRPAELVVQELRLPAAADDPQQQLADLIAAHPRVRVWVPLLIGGDCADGQLAPFWLSPAHEPVFQVAASGVDASADPASHASLDPASADPASHASAAAAGVPAPTGLVAFTDPQVLLSVFPAARPQQLGVLDVIRRALMSGGSLCLDGVVLPSVACAALAVGDNWLAAWNDSDLRERLAQACAAQDLLLVDVTARGDGASVIRIGATAAQRGAVLRLVAELNDSPLFAARCGQLHLQLVPVQRL